ncbi:hypothetical protein P7K49_005829 [Saguinus oedipus]|uniref:Uncharacterized protein n=1 Tax=Saguinus oedipus TaxID=9490 RepID=A0ABQ9W0N2_SAGOE|nr:hypothetical protein P7K49_005829 [Saguinus oedipus]
MHRFCGACHRELRTHVEATPARTAAGAQPTSQSAALRRDGPSVSRPQLHSVPAPVASLVPRSPFLPPWQLSWPLHSAVLLEPSALTCFSECPSWSDLGRSRPCGALLR